jgi:hypothetical protein
MEIKIDSIKDVKNLLEGNHESQNRIQVGFDGDKKEENIDRQVGEKWFDSDGNEWEQKKGYKVKLGKVWQQELHEYLNSFPNCPKESCTCGMPKRLDEKMKKIHGMCFDCVVKMEHKIRIEGKWQEYEKTKMKENALAWLKEAERDKNLIVEELSRLEFANEFGDVEKWDTKVNKEELLKKIEDEFQTFRTDFIEKLEKDLENMNESQ